MNRLKFRLWDRKQEEYTSDGFVIHPDGTVEFPLGGWDLAGYKADPTDFILEQSTGAKDVDGDLIYESDLLEVDDGGSKVQMVVILSEAKFMLKEVGFNSLYVYDIEEPWLSSKKIIGNVHKNPELIEED